jgi:hypothetical protein
MIWTVGLPARGAFTLQDDGGVGIQGNLGEGGTSEESRCRRGSPCELGRDQDTVLRVIGNVYLGHEVIVESPMTDKFRRFLLLYESLSK